MYRHNNAFIQITKKKIITLLKEQGVKTKYHTAIAIAVKEEVIYKSLLKAIATAIDKLEQMQEKVYKDA